MRRLLLVTPSFHEYWRPIAKAFTQLDYDVVVHPYDHASKAEKVFNKLRYELPGKVRGRAVHLSPELVTRRAIKMLRTSAPSHVLVVRGDALTEEFWQAVSHSGASRLLWLYDELRRMTYPSGLIERWTPVASYSAADVAELRARGVSAEYVPLAFDPGVALGPPRPSDEFTFIGARFARREALLESLQIAGLPVRCYGRDWSSHWIDRLRTYRFSRTQFPAGRDLALAEAWSVMRDSLGTLNIHGDQDGFTMRTFEACGAGAVQLIDRSDVAEFFEPGKEILTFDSPEALVERAKAVAARPQDYVGLRERAQARARAEHTFWHRARKLEQLWA